MKKSLLLPAIGAMALVWTAAFASTADEQKTHPELGAQEMYIACSECHRESTPEVYSEWYESAHGIGMVKCYQCHGTFETFRVTPDRDNCAVCHEKMMDKCPQDKTCWQCHAPHGFTVK